MSLSIFIACASVIFFLIALSEVRNAFQTEVKEGIEKGKSIQAEIAKLYKISTVFTDFYKDVRSISQHFSYVVEKIESLDSKNVPEEIRPHLNDITKEMKIILRKHADALKGIKG